MEKEDFFILFFIFDNEKEEFCNKENLSATCTCGKYS